MAEDRPLWHLQYQDPTWTEPREYVFDPQKLLTVSALRQIKEWYGIEIGRYLAFIQAFSQGDPEAALCALWLVRRAAGEVEVPEPNRMPDFSMGDFYHSFEAAGESEEEADPLNTGEEIPSSTETPTPSEPSTSASSPTSADSSPQTSVSAPGSTS